MVCLPAFIVCSRLFFAVGLSSYSPGSIKMAQRSDAARIRELYQIASDACNAVMTKGENDLLGSYETVFRNLMNSSYTTKNLCLNMVSLVPR